jgi:hypothetical protein
MLIFTLSVFGLMGVDVIGILFVGDDDNDDILLLLLLLLLFVLLSYGYCLPLFGTLMLCLCGLE